MSLTPARPTEVYYTEKHIYVLSLSQAPYHLAFQNVKKAVTYINGLSIGKGFEIADYYNVVSVLRKHREWNYQATGLGMKLKQVLVHGVKVKSSRKVDSPLLLHSGLI